MLYGKYGHNLTHYYRYAHKYPDIYGHTHGHVYIDLYKLRHAVIHSDSLYIYLYSHINGNTYTRGDINGN
jgi:hypothetical protein